MPPRRGGRRREGLADLDLEHPTLSVGIGVDQLGPVRERLVDGRDDAGDRDVHVGDRLGRLDLGDARAGDDVEADIGKLHEHDVAQAVLGEIGDADAGHAGIQAHPLVLAAVAKILGNVHPPSVPTA